jgi:hypothetical protein
MLQRLQVLALKWFPFLEKHIWDYPIKLQKEECIVYGTGYESWGLWAHLNATLFIAESLSWDDSLFANDKTKFKSFETRKSAAIAMFRYALGYHTTGDFVGAGGTRWGGEPSDGIGKEGYNNWHSPLWVAFLAEVYLTLEPQLDKNLKDRFLKAVVHDADVQTQLNINNFDGEAEENKKASHPESNAWKACLLLLARYLAPSNANVSKWQELENRLWVSSFARPFDEKNTEKINGKSIQELVFGNHITNTFNIVHHGFLHPCYMIFPLLSRLQAARFSTKFAMPYPNEAAFHEEEVLARLTPFIMNGRVIYPAGQDWPRWSYGQFYLLPILIYRDLNLGQDFSEEIKGLIHTRETDASHSNNSSFVIHRYGELLNKSAWEAHRFESDAAASLVQAIQILKTQTKNQQKKSKTFAEPICFEPLAKTAYLKRKSSFFSMSARACEGPSQLLAINEKDPHLLEWRNNGCPQAIRLHGIGSLKKDVIENDRFQLMGDSTIASYFEIQHSKESYKLPSFKMLVNAAVLPDNDIMFVKQKVIANCYSAASKISMHVWKFTQSPHNNWQRKITFQNGEINLNSKIVIEQEIKSPWVCVDNDFYLTLPKNQPHQSWFITQGNHHDDNTGISWFEIFVKVTTNPQTKYIPQQLIGESAITVSFTKQPMDAKVTMNDQNTIFQLTKDEFWNLTTEPKLEKIKSKI